MNRIETTHDKLYIKGVKSGSESITLTCDDPITVSVTSYTNELNGDVTITTQGNNTNTVVINISYEDLYLNGETYSGVINASTALDALSIPIIINCSDTLIYTNIPNNIISNSNPITIEYSSLPEVNKVTLVGTENVDISNRLTGVYPNPKALEISKDEILDYNYVLASNNLSQVAIWTDVPDVPEEPSGHTVLYFNITPELFNYKVNSDGEMFVSVYNLDGIDDVRNIKYPAGTRWGSDEYVIGSQWIYNIGGFYIDEPGSYFVEFEYDLLRDHAFINSNVSAIHSLDGKITDSLSHMFYNCNQLIDISPLRKWDVSNVRSLSSLFDDCELSDISPLANWDVSNVTDMYGLFNACVSLVDISPLANWDVSNVTDMRMMFHYCRSLSDISSLSNWDVSNVVYMSDMFRACTSLSDIFSLSNWDVSNVTNMSWMFRDCTSLSDISSLSNWDVSNVTDMSDMFYECSSLTDISSLSNWDVSNVTDMSDMFHYCTSLSDISSLSNWDVSNVTDMRGMFNVCKSLITANLNWDVSNVTNMSYMFANCYNLTHLSGLKNLKVSLNLAQSSLLTHESLMNVINNLAVVTTSPTLTLDYNNLPKLTDDEIAIATNKGWTVS